VKQRWVLSMFKICPFLVVLVILIAPLLSFAQQPVSNAVTFGGVLSSDLLQPQTENQLFQYQSQHGPASCMTYFWFTGAFDGLPLTRFRFYIDGETEPSIDMEYFLGHGIGFGDENSPWGTQYNGKGSTNAAVYNYYRIPFQKSITITAQMLDNITIPQVFWFVVRGVDGMHPVVGGWQLPDNARLRLYRNENITLQPLEFVNLTDSPNKGMLMQTTLAVSSANENYLEGCFRAFINNNSTMMLLSSGTEDYFQSAFYFYNEPDNPRFYFPGAGLTHFENSGFSAYKFHIDEPVFFQQGLRLVWRNGDTIDPSNGLKCVDVGGNVVGSPQVSQVWTYAWVYEWH